MSWSSRPWILSLSVLFFLAGCGGPRTSEPLVEQTGVDAELQVDRLLQAAEQGNAEAQNALGIGYANGFDVAKDEGEAVNWYRLAAE